MRTERRHHVMLVLQLGVVALALCRASMGLSATAPQPLEVAANLLAKITQAPVRNFSTRDFGREQYGKARSVLVPQARATVFLRTLRSQLPPGIIAFVGTTKSLEQPPAQGVEIVVAPGKDQFDILRVAASDAVNYDMQTEDLIEELRAWDRDYGIDIWQAETDTIVLDLKSSPKDINAFAERVYKFCPDIVDQGSGDLPELAREIARTRQVYLWWD